MEIPTPDEMNERAKNKYKHETSLLLKQVDERLIKDATPITIQISPFMQMIHFNIIEQVVNKHLALLNTDTCKHKYDAYVTVSGNLIIYLITK